MARPSIPAEIRRAVLVEAGHKCAVPMCRHPDIEIHHIVPWEQCRTHEYKNLIALCPNCHRRAHKNEIDRTALFLHKNSLLESFRFIGPSTFSWPIVEAKRRIYAVEFEDPNCIFDFEFPDFCQTDALIASKNIEEWGTELLALFQQSQDRQRRQHPIAADPPIKWLRGTYDVVRRDLCILSVLYRIEQMCFDAAHRSNEPRVQNFLLDPFQPLTLGELLITDESLGHLAELSAGELLQNNSNLDAEHVKIGTRPITDNFSLFTIDQHGFRFIFEEYQVASYALGEQYVYFPFYLVSDIIRSELLEKLMNLEN